MTNKLKKEIEVCEENINILKKKINENAKGHYDAYTHSELISAIEKNKQHIEVIQAKLSQKQEDDERFEEFIKRLKEDYLKLGTRVLNNKSDIDVLDLIDKLAGDELNGEKKKCQE